MYLTLLSYFVCVYFVVFFCQKPFHGKPFIDTIHFRLQISQASSYILLSLWKLCVKEMRSCQWSVAAYLISFLQLQVKSGRRCAKEGSMPKNKHYVPFILKSICMSDSLFLYQGCHLCIIESMHCALNASRHTLNKTYMEAWNIYYLTKNHSLIHEP